MKTTDEIKLLPCPFCGEKPVLKQAGKTNYWWIGCEICLVHDGKGCGVSRSSYDKDVAIFKWNTRTPDISSLVEALERVSAISCGEAQVADTDTDAMSIIFECADKALAKFRNLQ